MTEMQVPDAIVPNIQFDRSLLDRSVQVQMEPLFWNDRSITISSESDVSPVMAFRHDLTTIIPVIMHGINENTNYFAYVMFMQIFLQYM
jgi:hypothetical protein